MKVSTHLTHHTTSSTVGHEQCNVHAASAIVVLMHIYHRLHLTCVIQSSLFGVFAIQAACEETQRTHWYIKSKIVF